MSRAPKNPQVAARNQAYTHLRSYLIDARARSRNTYVILTKPPVISKNVDNTVDGALTFSERAPPGISPQQKDDFLNANEETVTNVITPHWHPSLFKPPGVLWFSYVFVFHHPGELADTERKRRKRRRYVARKASQREGFFISTPMGWIHASDNNALGGRWIEGHTNAHFVPRDYLDVYPDASLQRITLLLRWVPDGETPSRALLG